MARRLAEAILAPADRLAETPTDTLSMLEAADRAITHRLDHGGYADPTPDTPGILITVDEGQHVFAGNPHATALAERITTLGGPAGVGLVLMLVFVPVYRREQRHFAKLVHG